MNKEARNKILLMAALRGKKGVCCVKEEYMVSWEWSPKDDTYSSFFKLEAAVMFEN